jgi:hypothetical protein
VCPPRKHCALWALLPHHLTRGWGSSGSAAWGPCAVGGPVVHEVTDLSATIDWGRIEVYCVPRSPLSPLAAIRCVCVSQACACRARLLCRAAAAEQVSCAVCMRAMSSIASWQGLWAMRMTPIRRAPVGEIIRRTDVAPAKEVARQKRCAPSSRATNGALSVRRSAARDARLIRPRSWVKSARHLAITPLREDRHCLPGP